MSHQERNPLSDSSMAYALREFRISRRGLIKAAGAGGALIAAGGLFLEKPRNVEAAFFNRVRGGSFERQPQLFWELSDLHAEFVQGIAHSGSRSLRCDFFAAADGSLGIGEAHHKEIMRIDNPNGVTVLDYWAMVEAQSGITNAKARSIIEVLNPSQVRLGLLRLAALPQQKDDWEHYEFKIGPNEITKWPAGGTPAFARLTLVPDLAQFPINLPSIQARVWYDDVRFGTEVDSRSRRNPRAPIPAPRGR